MRTGTASPSILVRAPNWIGDQVLAYPFFHYLRRAYPRSRIVSACAPWVAAAQFHNLVDEVVVLSKPAENTWSAKLQTLQENARALKAKGPWDLGISLPNSFSAAWLLHQAGCGQRIGYRGDGRRLLLKPALPWGPASEQHRAEAYLGLLPATVQKPPDVAEFWGVLPENDLDPGVPGVPGVEDGFDAERAWLPAKQALRPPGEPYWVLAPGSAAESRRWPIESFAELARLIIGETGLSVVLVGGAGESPAAARLLELVEGVSTNKILDLTGKGPVSSYWPIFRGARFTVSNDSGLAHVAALCGSAVQVVWGAGDPRRTAPLGPGRVKLSVFPAECWPCERNSCIKAGHERNQCLRGVHPDTVWKEIKSGLRVF